MSGLCDLLAVFRLGLRELKQWQQGVHEVDYNRPMIPLARRKQNLRRRI